LVHPYFPDAVFLQAAVGHAPIASEELVMTLLGTSTENEWVEGGARRQDIWDVRDPYSRDDDEDELDDEDEDEDYDDEDEDDGDEYDDDDEEDDDEYDDDDEVEEDEEEEDAF
jgi:hypothetical protein